jgi:hypothetical protein
VIRSDTAGEIMAAARPHTGEIKQERVTCQRFEAPSTISAPAGGSIGMRPARPASLKDCASISPSLLPSILSMSAEKSQTISMITQQAAETGLRRLNHTNETTSTHLKLHSELMRNFRVGGRRGDTRAAATGKSKAELEFKPRHSEAPCAPYSSSLVTSPG